MHSERQDGVWLDGVWLDGVWLDGVWLDGVRLDGVWLDGVWLDGVRYEMSKTYTCGRHLHTPIILSLHVR